MRKHGQTKRGETLDRWTMKDSAFDSLRKLPLLETRAKHLLRAIMAGTVSTNVFSAAHASVPGNPGSGITKKSAVERVALDLPKHDV